MAKPFKLPVLPAEESAPLRPAWQWVGFGALAVLVLWLPLAALAQTLAVRLIVPYAGALANPEDAAVAVARLAPSARIQVVLIMGGLQVAALAVAALLGGGLVGRWGGEVGIRHAALAGALATGVALVLAFVRTGPSWAALVAIVVGTGAAALGGQVGRARRRSV